MTATEEEAVKKYDKYDSYGKTYVGNCNTCKKTTPHIILGKHETGYGSFDSKVVHCTVCGTTGSSNIEAKVKVQEAELALAAP